MNNLKHTGVRISQYPQAVVNDTNHKKRLELHHNFISWAPAYYGITTINKNYQVAIQALRQDFLGFVGVQNAKSHYRDYITFWQGDWFNKDIVKSYVWQWPDTMGGHFDYIKNKHGLDKAYDAENNISRVYILNDAPLPLETTFIPVNAQETSNHGEDPNPHSVKLVSKKYVDDRHNGVRKIQKSEEQTTPAEFGSELKIRPYSCFYQYSAPPLLDTNDNVHTINICDTEVLQDGRTIKDLIRHNRLRFYIRIANNEVFYRKLDDDGNKYHANNLKLLVNGEDKVLWSYENEFTEILREARPKFKKDGTQLNAYKSHIFIRCEAEYIDGKFTVTCSNFFGRGKNTKRIIETYFQDGQTEIDVNLSLHENESFITQIPEAWIESKDNKAPVQYTITLDGTSLEDDYHEYTWNYYVVTPTKRSDNIRDEYYYYDDVIFQAKNASIMWAMEDGHNIAPKLEPNKLYCLEFVKVFDEVIIGRIKYFVNLIKKS